MPLTFIFNAALDAHLSVGESLSLLDVINDLVLKFARDSLEGLIDKG